MKRMLFAMEIKPDCVEEYKKYHANVWPELEKTYKDAGIMKVSCFVHENSLLIYSEYDETIFPASREELLKNEVELRWQAAMKPLMNSDFEAVEYKEVYRMD